MAKANLTSSATNRDRNVSSPDVAHPASDPAVNSLKGRPVMNIQSAITAFDSSAELKEPNTPSPDEKLLAADGRLRTALAVINSRGSFCESEIHSPTETDAYDAAEFEIGHATATTVQGALVKAWIVWGTMTNGFTDESRVFGDIVRKRELGTLQAMQNDLDWDHHAMCTLVSSLTQIAKQSCNAPAANSQEDSHKRIIELEKTGH